MSNAENQMEAIELCMKEIKELNSRIADGEQVIKDCKEQMRMLKNKRSLFLRMKQAAEKGDFLKFKKLCR